MAINLAVSMLSSPRPSTDQYTALNEFRNPRSSVLILCRHFGGYGGEENYIMCLVDALKAYNTVVFATKSILHHGFVPVSRTNLIVTPYSTSGFITHLARNARRTSLFVGFSADRFPKDTLVFKALDLCTFVKVLVPAGNDVTRVVAHYDHVAWEAGNAHAYGFEGHAKNLLLHPPGLHPMNLPIDFPSFVPEAPFYLTVFNSYNSGMKGTAALYEVANSCLHPIIWCTAKQPLPPGIPGKLYPVAASRSLLSMLMNRCRAYICFSSTEGFGWSNFEAMMHERPIISKPVGVAGDFSDQILDYRDIPHLIEILNQGDIPESVSYDLQGFSSQHYLSQIERLIAAKRLA